MEHSMESRNMLVSFTFHSAMTAMGFYMTVFMLLCLPCCLAQPESESRIQQVLLHYDVLEETLAGQKIGNIPDDARLADKHSQEILRQLQYSFLSRPSLDKFSLDRRSGDLKLASKIDREAVCDNYRPCNFVFDIAVQPREYFLTVKVNVTIVDINDHAPTFPRRSLDVEIQESVAPGQPVAALPQAEDKDSGTFGLQQYQIVGLGRTFRIMVHGLDAQSGEAYLMLNEKLDRETKDRYSGKIVALDGGIPPKTGELIINIKVTDANDNSPVFDKEDYEFFVQENVRPPHRIGQVKAKDIDSGPNGDIRYKLGAASDDNYGDLFQVNEVTGELFTIGFLDYETEKNYYLSLEAVDRGINPHTGQATVIVTLQDYNDNAPEVDVQLLNTEVATIPETADLGTFVAHLQVHDKDSSVNGEFDCMLDSKNFTLVEYAEKEYQIVTKTYMDREKEPRYELPVVCRDHGVPPRSSTNTVTVHISDVNDNRPKFSVEHYNLTIVENNKAGQIVGRVTASDPDFQENGTVEYFLPSGASPYVIERKTGIIRASRQLNYELSHKSHFHVIAMDKGKPQQSSTARITVTVADENDKVPIFSEPMYVFDVFENEPFWTRVGQVHARDGDSHLFNNITYILAPSPEARDLFAIESTRGVIHTRKELDREEKSQYQVTVIAANPGYPGMSSSIRVSIVVKDRNDHAPRFVFPTEENHTVQVSPHLPVGFSIARISAHDKDSGVNAHVVYSATDTPEEFHLHSSTGILSVAKSLEQYTHKKFEMHIIAKDSGSPAKASTMLLEVIVNASVPRPAALASPQTDNFVIIISLSTVCGICIIVLVVAIAFTWYKRRNRWYKADPVKEKEQKAVLQGNLSSESGVSDSSPCQLGTKYSSDSSLHYNQTYPEMTTETVLPDQGSLEREGVAIHPTDHQDIQFHPVRFKAPKGTSVYEHYHPQPSFLKPSSADSGRSHSFQIPAIQLMRHSPDAGSGSSVDSGHGPSEEGGGFGDVPLHVMNKGHRPSESKVNWNTSPRRNATDV